MDFLLVLTEHVLLSVTAEALRVNIDWKLLFLKGGWSVSAKFHVVGDIPCEPYCMDR